MTKSNEKSKHTPKFVNEVVSKKRLSNLLAEVFEAHGNAASARFANNLKDLGFKYATKASVTISIDDLSVPPQKAQFVRESEEELQGTHDKFERGEITEVERYNKVIDTWGETTEKVTEAVVANFDRHNPVYMMAFSGARGNISQVRQLVGMRGLMADSEGKIIDLPIKSNFREGLSVTEYIISAYGARKGLVDTALKTADSGYLTRRLVDVAQDVIIRDVDCLTKKSLEIFPLMDGETIAIGIGNRVIGRHAAETVKDASGEVIVKKGELIDRVKAELLDAAKPKSVKIRSTLTCESKYGVCQQCYGWSLTDNKLANLGEAIGIIAAQSIGEPGTQLTMRTFHTGGAVAGSGKTKDVYIAPCAGTVSHSLTGKEIRTKYGDLMLQLDKAGKIKVGSKSVDVAAGAEILARDGDTVREGQFLGNAPVMSKKKLLTEKASKDVITTQAGIVQFEDFGVDETTDRQGNISKLANKQGTIWVKSGEVLPLPPSGNIVVENNKKVSIGDVLSETVIKCEHGGEIRYGQDVLIEKSKVGGREVSRLTRGRLINVINASIGAANARLEQSQQGNSWILNDESERYTLKVVNGESIESGKIIAELNQDKNTPVANCSGEVIFDGLEIDERKVVTKAGNLIFIPEEVHSVSKDASLVNCENGAVVEPGFEIVKDVYTTIGGVVNIVIENNIVHDVTITPGELFEIKNPDDINYQNGDIIKKAGIEIMPGVKTKKPSMVTLFTNNETGETKLLLREVQVYKIEPRAINFQSETTDPNISILPITQMNYRHGDRIRNINGGALNKTSIILYAQNDYKESKGLIEFTGEDDLNIIFQENIILRTDRGNTSSITEVLVKPGEYVKPQQAVARVQTVAKSDGVVFISNSDSSRILVMTEHDKYPIDCSAAPKVKVGDYVRAGDLLDKSTKVDISGEVVEISGKKVIVRKARPFLISYGTRLQVDNNSLVQQGDPLAAIIYEKIKTGDIVQGLPKVEELLEGRKPKEPAIMSDVDGIAEVKLEEGSDRLIITNEDGAKEFDIPPGQNIIVANGEKVERGTVLTDGQPNPHEFLEYRGVDAVQQFLVDEVQSVYNSQGVEISNKHLEVIVRQMTRKVRVDEPGDTVLLTGELVDINHFRHVNQEIEAKGRAPSEGTHVLLGLTKASLNTESFISAASFQETTRILAEASIKGKSDWLYGLKENVIIGRLIPAGTGFDPAEDSDTALSTLAVVQEEEEGLLETVV